MADSEAPVVAPPTPTRNPLRRFYNWIISWADHPAGVWVLFLITVLDSCVLLMPPYPFLIALCLGKPRRALWFAAVCSAGSLLGAIGGYFIGAQLWEWTGQFFFNHLGWMGFTQKYFDSVKELYQHHAFWVIVVTGGLTPVPFKVFTIGAGVCAVPFGTFVLATAVGRTMRFYAVAVLLYYFGERARNVVDRYFNWLAIVFIVLMALGVVAIALFSGRSD